MCAKARSNLFFRKKVYSKIYNPLQSTPSGKIKKIIPSSKMSGLREEFKKVFLPLLIDVFELRKRIENHKLGQRHPFVLNEPITPPQEILQNLTALQNDIEESRRWCEGVILQIAKGIAEAKEALQFIEEIPHKGKDGDRDESFSDDGAVARL